MSILSITIVAFAVLETLNVTTLYFQPGTRFGNGVGVLNAWGKSKTDPDLHQFVRYLVFWVAGTKLIFITLLLVILRSPITVTSSVRATSDGRKDQYCPNVPRSLAYRSQRLKTSPPTTT